MPISEKIKGEISHLPVSKDGRQLLLDILEVEDKGSFRYQTDYQSLIKEFMNQHKNGDELL